MTTRLNDIIGGWMQANELAPDEDDQGRYTFTFDGEHEVFVGQLGANLCFESPLGRLPAHREKAEDLLTKLTGFQLGRSARHAEALTLTGDDDTLTLTRIAPIDEMTETDFKSILSDFVNAASFWSSQFNANHHSAAAPVVPAQMIFP